MIDKKKEERLTEFQMNIEIVREVTKILCWSSRPAAEDLLEKAIKNLDKLITSSG